MRLSGPQMFENVTRGIMDQGANVVNIGLVSTDQFYFACSKLGLPGMMVTASHNPKEYNGFKMVRKMPYLLSGNEGIQDLRRIVEQDDYAKADKHGSMRSIDLSGEFIEAVLGLIDVEALRPANLKVVADTGNGTVGPMTRAQRYQTGFPACTTSPTPASTTTAVTCSGGRRAPRAISGS